MEAIEQKGGEKKSLQQVEGSRAEAERNAAPTSLPKRHPAAAPRQLFTQHALSVFHFKLLLLCCVLIFFQLSGTVKIQFHVFPFTIVF